MKLQRPFEALAPTLDGDVLLVLAGADASFTGGQLARLVPDASTEGVRRAARRLAAQGLVSMERVGQAHTYSLNRDHLLAEPVLRIAQVRATFTARVRDHVDGWDEEPEVVVLFGSAARGQMRSDSDIDLFVVGRGGEVWDDQLDRLTQAVRRWTGNDARVLEMTPEEVADALGAEPIMDDLLRDGKVLWGSPAWLRERRARDHAGRGDR